MFVYFKRRVYMTEPIKASLFNEIKSFAKSHKVLCATTLGLAIVGFSIGKLVGRIVSKISESHGVTKKAEDVATNRFSNINENPLRTDMKNPTTKSSPGTKQSYTVTKGPIQQQTKTTSVNAADSTLRPNEPKKSFGELQYLR